MHISLFFVVFLLGAELQAMNGKWMPMASSEQYYSESGQLSEKDAHALRDFLGKFDGEIDTENESLFQKFLTSPNLHTSDIPKKLIACAENLHQKADLEQKKIIEEIIEVVRKAAVFCHPGKQTQKVDLVMPGKRDALAEHIQEMQNVEFARKLQMLPAENSIFSIANIDTMSEEAQIELAMKLSVQESQSFSNHGKHCFSNPQRQHHAKDQEEEKSIQSSASKSAQKELSISEILFSATNGAFDQMDVDGNKESTKKDFFQMKEFNECFQKEFEKLTQEKAQREIKLKANVIEKFKTLCPDLMTCACHEFSHIRGGNLFDWQLNTQKFQYIWSGLYRSDPNAQLKNIFTNEQISSLKTILGEKNPRINGCTRVQEVWENHADKLAMLNIFLETIDFKSIAEILEYSKKNDQDFKKIVENFKLYKKNQITQKNRPEWDIHGREEAVRQQQEENAQQERNLEQWEDYSDEQMRSLEYERDRKKNILEEKKHILLRKIQKLITEHEEEEKSLKEKRDESLKRFKDFYTANVHAKKNDARSQFNSSLNKKNEFIQNNYLKDVDFSNISFEGKFQSYKTELRQIEAELASYQDDAQNPQPAYLHPNAQNEFEDNPNHQNLFVDEPNQEEIIRMLQDQREQQELAQALQLSLQDNRHGLDKPHNQAIHLRSIDNAHFLNQEEKHQPIVRHNPSARQDNAGVFQQNNIQNPDFDLQASDKQDERKEISDEEPLIKNMGPHLQDFFKERARKQKEANL